MLQALGIGLGIGVVHAAVLFAVMILARTNAKKREDDTLAMMRERNDLDRDKVELLRVIAGIEESSVAVRMAIERRLHKIGANKREIEFLMSCELPDIDDWCATNLDDLRRSQ